MDNATPLPETLKPEPIEKHPGGRPTIMTDEILQKLRSAFLMGCNDRLACAYADIANQTLYNYQKAHPEFVEQKEAWKQHPIMKAINTIYKGLDNEDNAKWYLERKLKNEFAPRQEITGEEGKPLIVIDSVPQK